MCVALRCGAFRWGGLIHDETRSRSNQHHRLHSQHREKKPVKQNNSYNRGPHFKLQRKIQRDCRPAHNSREGKRKSSNCIHPRNRQRCQIRRPFQPPYRGITSQKPSRVRPETFLHGPLPPVGGNFTKNLPRYDKRHSARYYRKGHLANERADTHRAPLRRRTAPRPPPAGR